MHLQNFGVMPFLLLVIWSTACHPQYRITRFHILFCFLGTLCIPFLFECLAPLVLSMIFLPVVTNSLDELLSVYFWGILEFKKGIGVIVVRHIVFTSLQMLLSLKICLSLQDQLHQSLLCRFYLFLIWNICHYNHRFYIMFCLYFNHYIYYGGIIAS
jgi:hypothetical protein